MTEHLGQDSCSVDDSLTKSQPCPVPQFPLSSTDLDPRMVSARGGQSRTEVPSLMVTWAERWAG